MANEDITAAEARKALLNPQPDEAVRLAQQEFSKNTIAQRKAEILNGETGQAIQLAKANFQIYKNGNGNGSLNLYEQIANDPTSLNPYSNIVASSSNQVENLPSPIEQAKADTYTIGTGDSLSSISQTTGIGIDKLLQLNPQITNPDEIVAGQQLQLSPIPESPNKSFLDPVSNILPDSPSDATSDRTISSSESTIPEMPQETTATATSQENQVHKSTPVPPVFVPTLEVNDLSPTFFTKIKNIAGKLQVSPADLMHVMAFETAGTLHPSKRAEDHPDKAVGLIQFTKKTAKKLGTTKEALSNMTPEQQLDYVELYFFGGIKDGKKIEGIGSGNLIKIRRSNDKLTDLYLAVFAPGTSMGRWDPDQKVYTAANDATPLTTSAESLTENPLFATNPIRGTVRKAVKDSIKAQRGRKIWTQYQQQKTAKDKDGEPIIVFPPENIAGDISSDSELGKISEEKPDSLKEITDEEFILSLPGGLAARWQELQEKAAEELEEWQDTIGENFNTVQTLASEFMQHEGITGISGNEAIQYIRNNFNKFMAWTKTRKIKEPVFIDDYGDVVTPTDIPKKPEFLPTPTPDFKKKSIEVDKPILKIPDAKKPVPSILQPKQPTAIAERLSKPERKEIIFDSSSKLTSIPEPVKPTDITVDPQYRKISPSEEHVVHQYYDSQESPDKRTFNFQASDKEPVEVEIRSADQSIMDDYDKVLAYGNEVYEDTKAEWTTMAPIYSDAPIKKVHASSNSHIPNLVEHEDGTWTVLLRNGKSLGGLNEANARGLAAYNVENARAMAEGAPNADEGMLSLGWWHEMWNRTVAGVGPTVATSAQGLREWVFGATTLQEHVDEWNEGNRGYTEFFGEERPGWTPESDISQADLQAFKDGDIDKLSEEKFAILTELEEKRQYSKSWFDYIEKEQEDWVASSPVNRKFILGVQATAKVIAERDGHYEALLYAYDNSGTFMEGGFDSIPFTLAMYMGNLPYRIGYFATTSAGRAAQMIEEYKNTTGLEPTQEIRNRIGMSAAASMAAEYMQARLLKFLLKGPGGATATVAAKAAVERANKVAQAINRNIPKIVGIPATLAAKMSVPFLKLGTGSVGEGGQEIVSQQFEHYGVTGEALPTHESMMAGVQGSLGGPAIIFGTSAFEVGKAGVKKALAPSKATRARQAIAKKIEHDNEQLVRITAQERINHLDEQIDNLNTPINEGLDGIETENQRFKEIYQDLKSKEFTHADAVKEAKQVIKNEAEALQKEREALAKETPSPKFKDSELFSKPIITEIHESKKKIAAAEVELKKAEETKTTLPIKATKIKADETKKIEANIKKLEQPLNKEQLNAHKQNTLQMKALREKIIDESTGKVTDKKIKQVESESKGFGTKLGKGELVHVLNEIEVTATRLIHEVTLPTPKDLSAPISVGPDNTFEPEEGSGLEKIPVTDDAGNITGYTIQLIAEPKDWLDDQGRRKTRKDFDSNEAFETFKEATRQYDAAREPALTQLGVLWDEATKVKPGFVNTAVREQIYKMFKELSLRDLTDEDKKIIHEKLEKIITKDFGAPLEESKSIADKLFSGPDAFNKILGKAQNASKKEILEILADPETDVETKGFFRSILQANRDRKKQQKKNMSQVNWEIVDGDTRRYTGLHTWRDKIIAVLNNAENLTQEMLERKFINYFDAMETHATNLVNKLTAFKEAARRNAEDPAGEGYIWAVRGLRTNQYQVKEGQSLADISQDTGFSVNELVGFNQLGPSWLKGGRKLKKDEVLKLPITEARKMQYTVTRISKAEYQTKRQQGLYYNQIDKNSTRLIAQLEEEVQLGHSALATIRNFMGTSIQKRSAILDQDAGHQIQYIANLKQLQRDIGRGVKEITDEELAELKSTADLEQDLTDLKEQRTAATDTQTQERLNEEISAVEAALAKQDTLEAEAKPQPGDQLKLFPEDEISPRKDAIPDETAETPKPTATSTEQAEAAATAEAEAPQQLELGLTTVVQSFIESATKIYETVITKEVVDALKHPKKNLENMLGMLGKTFTDLVQIGSRDDRLKTEGLQTLTDSDFANHTTLKVALEALGVSPLKAEALTKRFTRFKERYNKILGNPSENYALAKPLTILLRDNKLPDQIIFSMMIGAMTWRHQTPNNSRFTASWQRSLFLYGDRDTTLTNDEEMQLNQLGYGYHDTAERIGRNINSLMQFSAKKLNKDASQIEQAGIDLYNENLVPALGMMAIEIAQGMDTGAIFEVHKHVWKFGERFVEGRNFNNFDAKLSPHKFYKHIKVKEDSVPAKIGVQAVEELVVVTKAAINIHEGKPLQEPPAVSKKIKGTFKNIPKKVRRVLKALQNTKWNVSETMDTVSYLDLTHMKALENLIGIVPIPKNWKAHYHQSEKESLEASNKDKRNALREIIAAYDHNGENNSLIDFYFKFELQNQHRVRMEGRINPQNSKVTRYLLQSWGQHTYDQTNLWKFKLAIAQNMGLSTDKHDLIYAENEFNTIINNRDVLAAVTALQNLQANKGNPKQETSKLAEALLNIKSTPAYQDGNMSILTAVTALAKYLQPDRRYKTNFRPNSSFQSDILYEIDGISNGFAINQLQFPDIFGDYGLNQTGTYFGKTAKHDTTQQDIYEKLAFHVLQGADHINDNGETILDQYPEKAWEYWDSGKFTFIKDFPSEPTWDILRTNKQAFGKKYRRSDAALNNIFPDFVTGGKELRKLVKYPFIMSMYGAGTSRVSQDVAKEVIKDIYKKLSRTQRIYNNLKKVPRGIHFPVEKTGATSAVEYFNNTIKPLIDDLAVLGAFKSGVDPEGKQILTKEKYLIAIQNGNSFDKFFNDTNIIQELHMILAPRFYHGLQDILGQSKSPRNTVVQMGAMLHDIFMLHYKKAYNQKLAEINEEHRKSLKEADEGEHAQLTKLTKPQIIQLLTDVNGQLIKAFPQYKGPLSETLDEFIDLSKTQFKSSDQSIDSQKVVVDRIGADGTKNVQTVPSQLDFVTPGVSALIRQIINMDSVLLTQTLGGDRKIQDKTGQRWKGDTQLLMLHDAFIGSPEQLSTIADIYGKLYLHYNRTHSIIEQTYKQLITVVDELPPEMRLLLNDKLIEDQFKRNIKPENHKFLEDILNEFEHQVDEVTDARKALERRIEVAGGVVSRQMYMPEPDEITEASTSAVEEFRNTQVKPALRKRRQQLKKTELKEPTPTVEDQLQEQVQKEVDDKLKSLDDAPRNPLKEAIDLGDLTNNTIGKLFNKFKEFSSSYYTSNEEMAAHTETLNSVLNILDEGVTNIGGIRLSLEHINGITQGEYDIASNAIRISLQNNPPFIKNQQSPQEVYVHEFLHATTYLAIRENPIVAARIGRLYDQVEKSLYKDFHGKGYEVFLSGIPRDQWAKDDIELAQKQYNYLFQGREKNKIHEFLAYAVTNRQIVEYLKTQPVPRREGYLGKLIDLIIDLVNSLRAAFGARTFRNVKGDAFTEMLAATEHLVAIQARHESKYEALRNKGYKGLDKADEWIKQLAEDTAVKFTARPGEATGRIQKSVSTIVGGVQTIFVDNPGTLRARQLVDRALNKTLRGIANEMGAGAMTEKMIEHLLHVKSYLDKARVQAEVFTSLWFHGATDDPTKNGIWRSIENSRDKKQLSVETNTALTKIMFRTDLSSLLHADLKKTGMNLTHAQVMNFLVDEDARNSQLKKIANILGLAADHPARKYAQELGFHLATGKTRLRKAHMNAFTIAQDYLNNPTVEQVALLDAYATLTALQYSNKRQLSLVHNLSQNEFAANAAENGMTDILDSHLSYRNRSQIKQFDNNPTQMVKGYIVERVDEFTHLKVGANDAQTQKEMRQAGYTEQYELARVGKKQTINTLYVTRGIPEVPDISGVMSTTNYRNMGTTLTEILVRDPAYQHPPGHLHAGRPDMYRIEAEVNKFIKREEQGSTSLQWNDSLSMRPLRDQNGAITDYRVMMDHQTTEAILQPQLEIQHVFAHMNSAAIDRENTIESDKKTVELLVHEQIEMMPAFPEMKWVDIMDPTGPYIDRYRKLPQAVREHMKEYAVGGQFLVREDVIDKVFGYQAFDLASTKIVQSYAHPTLKRVIALLHHIGKKTVGYGKNRVVIAMPMVIIRNILSNFYQLLMRKIPIEFIFHHMYEGIHEYHNYERDSQELITLKHRIQSKGLDPETSEEAIRARRLVDRIEGNKIHQMTAAGLNSLIVEDINDAQTDGYFNKLRKLLINNKSASKYAEMIPDNVSSAASLLFMTKSSKPYQWSRHVVQLTDFLARYVMIEHETKVRGRAFKESMHEALNAFVLFDEALLPFLEALDVIGITSFLSYYLRNARASKRLVQTSPTAVGMSALVQHYSGYQTLGNVNSSWLAGDFAPNYLQTDDLFDEANNVTGWEIVMNDGRDLFN